MAASSVGPPLLILSAPLVSHVDGTFFCPEDGIRVFWWAADTRARPRDTHLADFVEITEAGQWPSRQAGRRGSQPSNVTNKKYKDYMLLAALHVNPSTIVHIFESKKCENKVNHCRMSVGPCLGSKGRSAASGWRRVKGG